MVATLKNKKYMKIINQTSDNLTLKDGKVKSLVAGFIFVLVGTVILISNPAGLILMKILLAAVFVIIGLLFVLFSTSTIVDFDKINSQIIYTKKSLIGKQSTMYVFADVFRVETRKWWHSSGRGGGQTLAAQSFLVLKNGQEISLDNQKSSSSVGIGSVNIPMGNSGSEVAIANQVAEFLGVPFEEIKPPTLGEVFSKIQSVAQNFQQKDIEK